MLRQLRSAKFIVLFMVLLLGYILGAAQKRASIEGKPFTPAIVIQSAIYPFQKAFYWSGHPFRSAKQALRTRKMLQKENSRLRAEVLRLTKENADLREEHFENMRLREALNFRVSVKEKMILARVIGMNPSQHFDTCTLDAGKKDGVYKSAIVITPRGLVGRVVQVAPSSCQVLLLRDPSSSVGAIVQRSRAQGICEGQQSETLLLNYLQRDADVRIGDIVISSGIGGIYPKGITIGRIKSIIHKPGDYLKSAEVSPSVDFETLEEAFIMLEKGG